MTKAEDINKHGEAKCVSAADKFSDAITRLTDIRYLNEPENALTEALRILKKKKNAEA